jgi:acetoin utilization deacetylase AcuC-like enzyme
MPKKVCYFYDPDVGFYYIGHNHPMRPLRVSMTNNLIDKYGLKDYMQIIVHTLTQNPTELITGDIDLTAFHSDDYVDFLKNVTPKNKEFYADWLMRCNQISR